MTFHNGSPSVVGKQNFQNTLKISKSKGVVFQTAARIRGNTVCTLRYTKQIWKSANIFAFTWK